MISFDIASKLAGKIEIPNTDFFYNKKTKERFYRKDLATNSKEFRRFYIPAPSLTELLGEIPKTIKIGHNIYYLGIHFDEAELTVLEYYLGDEIDTTLYSFRSGVPEEAATELIIKLLRYDKKRK